MAADVHPAPHPRPLPRRSRLALRAGRAVAGASRLAHMGTGSVIGGRASLLVDPTLLERLAPGRALAVVSATNGKTTITRMLAEALRTLGPVASNAEGANMGPGLVAALGAAPTAALGALELDERWLPSLLPTLRPRVVVLGNLSRDQLDRTQEVRRVADAWRAALDGPPVTVVANADDPLVVWAAGAAGEVIWVGAGTGWTADATGCPACSAPIVHGEAGAWGCSSCELARPALDVAREGRDVVWADGTRVTPGHSLPGRANAANAALALAAARAMGADHLEAARALVQVREVAGRYRRAVVSGATTRLLLAKNPSGWAEALEVACESPDGEAPRPVVAAINARIADGRDPSWLWDVPFERLTGRFVVATGERARDLAVRLRYAEVDHVTMPEASLEQCVRLALEADPHAGGAVDAIGNYTAFQDWLDEVGRG